MKDILQYGEILATVATIAAILIVIYQIRLAAQVSRNSRVKISQAEARLEKEPEKAKPAWDLARATLESYFNRNLSQITSIFWLSVIVMLIGFGIIVWGISQSIQAQSSLTPAIIASVAGIITEFIGATFLFIYRSTIQQATNYSKTLERINSVGMAMQILDTMPDGAKSDDLKSYTKATLVELLVRQAHDIPDNNIDGNKDGGQQGKA